jgi:hypothetical protein
MFCTRLMLTEWIGVLCLMLTNSGAADTIQEDVDFLISDESGARATSDLTYEQPAGVAVICDDNLSPAQMLTPQRRLGLQTAQRPQRTQEQRRESGVASVPFMIGDTGSGTCLSIGGLSTFTIEHPTLTCSRLNVAENNSPLPTNRNYISYRHFQNVTDVRVLTLFERSYDVDSVTLGHERTFWDGLASVELRLPMERRLTSNFGSLVNTVAVPPIIDPFIGGRQNELGNLSMIFKGLLWETSDCAISTGLALTVPTAEDFTYNYSLTNIADVQVFPLPAPPTTLRETENFGIEIQNETVYLMPYLGWIYQPTSRFFHHGFFQVEAAANPSTVRARGLGVIDLVDLTDPMNPVFTPLLGAFTPSEGRQTELHAQTLMRINLGCGYVLSENSQSYLKRLTGLLEMHYTATLQDAKLSTIPLDVDPPILNGLLDNFFTIGNFLNRTDIVNVVAGISANIGADGRTSITNGFALPVSSGEERAFDLEYNLQVQRTF